MGSTVRRLAGRDEEARATAGFAEAVATGAGHVLVVDGGAGTGRSALAALAVEQARGLGLGAALVRAGGRSPEPLAVAAGLLGTRTCDTVSAAAHDLLAGAGAGRVLVVDDAHRADTPSLEALAQVARNLDGRRLGILFTATPEVREPAVGALLDELRALPGSVLLRLEALDLETFGPLAGSEADAETVRALHVRTAGLPGLAAALSGCAPDAPVPVRIRAQVAARLNGLGADPTAVARAVAVLGGEVPLRLVQATSGLDRSTALSATDTLVRAGMCTVAGGVRMTAPVLGEAVVAGLDASAGDVWHRRAAAVLHDDGAPARDVGALLLAALPGGDAWTVERLLAAAAAAADAGAGTETVALLRRALAEPPPRDRLTTVLMELASAESRMADPRALERTEAALEVATEPEDRVSLRRLQARLMWLSGRLPEAVRRSEEAVGEAEPGTEVHGVVLSELLAAASMHDLEAIHSRPALVDLLRRAGDGWVPESPALAGTLATVLPLVLGDHRRVEALVDQALTEELWRLDSPPFGLRPDLVIGGLWLADALPRAMGLVEEGLRMAERQEDLVRLGMWHYWVAELRYGLGELDGAVAAGERAIDGSAGTYMAWLGYTVSVMVRAHLERGDPASAREVLLAAEPRVDPQQLSGIRLRLARARLLLHGGRPDEALEAARDVEARADALGHRDGPLLVWRVLAAQAAAALGEEAVALALAEEELRIAQRTRHASRLAEAERLLAAVGEVTAREELLEVSVDRLRALPRPRDLAASLLALGLERHRRGATAPAREALGEARELAERCGAAPLAAEALAGLHRTGARPRRHARSGPAALTGTERRIADLAADGRTNRSIAEELVLTHRTVEWHLGNIYAKLGIDSRRDLRSALDTGPGRNP